MLQIEHIKKDYKTGDHIQHALNDVSLNLRDNEFVAILGPSGSGKTTLLNVIGGLDRYDSGDLIINGVSTKKYKDRDWDAYRNHTIGFVFQSYNLIMHQSVLANVELALTISGISGSKRREMAENALRKVGLGEHMHKRPGQMSGGQMQRVAIARALVNNPDIVLADEPTGALDSETSVQIMDLLQEVAKDRLVVMVTHNPELAKAYATRTVTIKDGQVIGDTDPFIPDRGQVKPPVHKRLGKASMSFATALALSFNNLKTKKARTLLVAFAGSIGIIGIALILSLSNGVNQYIKNQEEETLSEYPLQLQQTGFSLSSLLTSGTVMSASSGSEADDGEILVMDVVEQMFGDVDVNDLKEIKAYIEDNSETFEPYVNAIEYLYNITPQIYLEEEEDVLQVNPSDLISSITGGSSLLTSMMGSSSGMDIFYQLPASSSLYQESYELMAGEWPDDSSDLVLVLSEGSRISDLVPYVLNMKDQEELQETLGTLSGSSTGTSGNSSGEAVTEAAEEDTDSSLLTVDEAASEEGISESLTEGGEKVTGEKTDDDAQDTYTYDDFLGMEFKLVNNCDLYAYDDEYEVWMDKSDNEEYIRELVSEGKTLHITGIIAPKEGSNATLLSQGIGYTADLTQEIMLEAADSEVVQAQLADPDTNIFTGSAFGDTDSDIDLSKLFSVDESSISDLMGGAFSGLGSLDLSSALSGMDFSDMDMGDMDMSDLGLDGSSFDFSKMLDADTLSKILPSYTNEEIAALLDQILVDKTREEWLAWFNGLFTDVLNGYTTYIGTDTTADVQNLGSKVKEYLGTQGARDILTAQIQSILASQTQNLISEEELRSFAKDIMEGFVTYLTQNPSALPDMSSLSSAAGIMSAVSQLTDQFESYLKGADEITSLQETLSSRLSQITVTDEQIQSLADALYNGYDAWAKETDSPQVDVIGTKLLEYLGTTEGQQVLLTRAKELINEEALTKAVSDTLSSVTSQLAQTLQTQISKVLTKVMKSIMKQITSSLTSAMSSVASQLSGSLSGLSGLFNMDMSALGDMISMNMSADEIQELLSSLLSGGQDSLDNNLASLGYADPDSPTEIDLYPVDFDAKSELEGLIDAYNDMQTAAGHEEKVISYTDLVATMMSSVTRIVNTISYVLIAFVAISLVVSSIMIGVITYISVLERRKEIGILRAIGASKRNISQVFNAETFITGLLAGAIGIGLTEILTVPINLVIARVIGGEGVRAQLPALSGAVLILLSVVLTMIAGLIPSGKAAKSDPVTALRSD